MRTRNAWLPTWLQPVAALAVIAVGWATHERYPAGEVGETLLGVGLAAVTLPGLVVAVVDAVRRSRRTRPGERPGYQRALDAIAPRGATPTMPRSVGADVLGRLAGWGLLQAVLGLALALLLMPLPVDDDWAMLAFLPTAAALGVAMVALVAGIAWLAVSVLRAAFRRDGHDALTHVPLAPAELNERRPLVMRALLLALGVCLVGLATFGIPYAVLQLADDPAPAWRVAARATGVLMMGGFVAAVVLSPVAFYRMVVRPAPQASVPG